MLPLTARTRIGCRGVSSGDAAANTRLRAEKPGRPHRMLTCALILAVCCGLGPVARAAAGGRGKPTTDNLSERWRSWVEDEVYPLITAEQKRTFLSLETEAQRREFAERLWILWGRKTGFGSAFRRIYQERLEFCRAEFGRTTGDRARALLIHGPPAVRYQGNCSEFFVPLEIWVWPYVEGLGENVAVLFYQFGGRDDFRLWNPLEGRQALVNRTPGADSSGVSVAGGGALADPRFRCPDGDTLMNMIGAAELWGKDPRVIEEMTQFSGPESEGDESASHRFMEFSALLPDGSRPLDFSVKAESWGNRGGLVDEGFAIDVPREVLGTVPVGGVPVVQLDVIGEISSGDHMVDRFRYVFSVPAAGDRLNLVLERSVRPGDYELRLKVADVHSKHAGILNRTFTASVTPTGQPPQPLEAPDGPEATPGRASHLPGLNGDSEDQPILSLVGPPGEAVSGVQRFEAVSRDTVARVTFLVNGTEILTKNRPPFDVDLDLGSLPRLTTVTAIAYDTRGVEVARDALSVNVGRERLWLRIQPLSPPAADGRTLVKVDVNIPSDAELDTLELFWNEELVATLRQPPFEAWVRLEGASRSGLLRAVATMVDGTVAEDVQFAKPPEFGAEVKVTTVELPVTVLDHSTGRSVENLRQEDFRVFEDGVEQTVSHFVLHRDVPVRLGIVIDSSGSMEETLPTVQLVVMGFLRDLLRPRDRAFIETFSDRPDLLATFTADFSKLESALLALIADRSTALYDAVITGLFEFSGVHGRRAMVVLTDGEDTASKHSFHEVLEYAQRAGVTIYTIGVGLPATKLTVRSHLKKMAEVTGGKAFFVDSDSGLADIYSEIDHELRTQYLLAYASKSDKPNDELRAIRVEVDRPNVIVRTISGFYPVGI